MGIEIRSVQTKSELKSFIKFPMELYKNNPCYVPPIVKDEMEALDKEANPVFKNAEAEYYLAFKEGKLVGRIAAIINWNEVNLQKKSKGRFGWFDFIDDLSVSKALLDTVETYVKNKNLESIEGPVGFSNLDKAGLLTMGFDEVATMVTLYNDPYYIEHLYAHAYIDENEWVEFKIILDGKIPDKIKQFNKIVQDRFQLKKIEFKSKQDLLKYVQPMFELLEKTYGDLPSFVPIPQYQIEHYKEKYFGLLNPDMVTAVEDKDNKLIAFAITMPSYSNALQKANGYLLPFGWYHLWQASKKNDSAAFYLIGVDPKYRGKGVTALIFEHLMRTFQKYGITNLETNPELADNKHVQALWKDLNPINHKRRKSFSKKLI